MEKLRSSCTIVLAIWVLASVALLAQGCNTTQSPNRQVSDVQITTQVKTALAQNVRASSLTNIDVNKTLAADAVEATCSSLLTRTTLGTETPAVSELCFTSSLPFDRRK